MFTTLQANNGTIPSGKNRLKEIIMERIHMNHLRDLIHRLRIGESERRIGLDMKISRQSVHKYHELAKQFGFLEKNTLSYGSVISS